VKSLIMLFGIKEQEEVFHLIQLFHQLVL
jgi:hypothetical protein